MTYIPRKNKHQIMNKDQFHRDETKTYVAHSHTHTQHATYLVGTLQLIFETFGSAENPGQRSSFGAPSTLKIFMIWSASPSPGNSGSPVSISARMQPTDHMSTAVE
jgi:hypothetical protein